LTVILPLLFTYLSWQIPYLIQTWELGDFVGVFGAIIGAILGFLLSELRQWTTEGKQADRVRTMLKLEIDQNISLLRENWEYWNKAIQSNKSSQKISNLCRSLRAIPLPQWSRRVWEGQVSLLPIALNEEENRKVDSLYSQLNKITKITSQLSVLVSDVLSLDVPEPYESALDLDSEPNRRYNQDQPKQERLKSQMYELMRNCEKVFQDVLDNGNPLSDES
jgi:hypothetical protein